MIRMRLKTLLMHRINLKGQIGIYLIMALVMDIIITAALAPLLDSVLNLLYTALGTDQVSIMIAHLIMPALIFSMIFGILSYKDPLRQQQVY